MAESPSLAQQAEAVARAYEDFVRRTAGTVVISPDRLSVMVKEALQRVQAETWAQAAQVADGWTGLEALAKELRARASKEPPK